MKWINLFLVLFFLVSKSSLGQGLLEQNDFSLEYQLNDIKVLVITYNNCSYEETIEMSNAWKKWGAEIDFAAPEKRIVAEKVKMTPKGLRPDGAIELKTDFLLHEVKPEKYDVIYVVGGDNYKELISEHKEDIQRIVNYSYKNDKLVTAFCHSPAVLSIFEFIKGKNVSVEGKPERKLLKDAGANVKNDIVTVDGNIITGRFPYSEAFIYTVAEALQFPNNNGPYQKIISSRNKTIGFIHNLANVQIFKDKPISRDTLDLILNAGQKSIISENYSYNHLTKLLCLDNKEQIEILKTILIAKNTDQFKNSKNPESKSEKYMNAMINNASTVIFVFVDTEIIHQSDISDNYMEMKYYSYAGGTSQNILLSAQALGFGGKLINIKWLQNMEEELFENFKVPKKLKLVNVMAVGYPDFNFVPTVTRKVEEYANYNTF